MRIIIIRDVHVKPLLQNSHSSPTLTVAATKKHRPAPQDGQCVEKSQDLPHTNTKSIDNHSHLRL